jgi:asparagine synthase (glutamine-hydrolysing)
MCGICGIYNLDKKETQKKELQIMNNRMTFRGPDSDGYYISNNVGIAMKRLAIIDLDTGEQPISDHDRDVHLVLNGEIYNFIELKKDLIEKGHKFKTNSDTEVLLRLYIEYEEKFIDKVNGIFSFAIFDKKNNKLLVYRDRLGVKPLYYYLDDKRFIFSSNLDSIENLIRLNKINLNSVFSYLLLNYTPDKFSIRDKIFKLPPGNLIKINKNIFNKYPYWSLDNKYKTINTLNFEDDFENLMDNIIKIQSRTDVKIGSFLSGGVDSTILTYLLSSKVKNFETFTANIQGKNNKDLLFSKKISEELNLKNNDINFDLEKKLEDHIDQIIYFLDEPIADTAIMTTYQLSKEAQKKNTKVIITGAGGDEIFGGYHRHYMDNKISNFLPNININLLLNISDFMKNDYQNYFLKLFSNEINFVLGASGANYNFLKNITYSKNDIKTILKKILDMHKKNKFKFNNLSDRLNIDLLNYLPDNILSLTDKMSMACSIEVRTPFLDHRLIEMVQAKNSVNNFGKNLNKSKKILYDTYSKKIKTNVWDRKKEGFNAPANKWILRNKDYLIKYFNESSNPVLKEIINIETLSIFIRRINQLSDRKIHSIYSLFILNKWLSFRNAK